MTTVLPQRKKLRLDGFDYAQNAAYFITICTHHREWLFGEVENGEMVLNPYGQIVDSELSQLAVYYQWVTMDAHVVMPNHLHCIIVIAYDWRVAAEASEKHTIDIPNIIGKFKAGVTRKIHASHSPQIEVWQKSYHDHIIRNEKEYQEICEYIERNPTTWESDCHNPASPKYMV